MVGIYRNQVRVFYEDIVLSMDAKDKTYLKLVGENIARVRKENNLTQVDVCSEIEMDKPYLSSIENGRQNPTLLTLKKLADAIAVPVNKLLNIEVEK